LEETLYIIGNGFDRYHSLDTLYTSFGKFLKERDNEVYELLLNYFGLPDLTNNDLNKNQDSLLWANLETSLSYLDFETVLDDNENYIASPSSNDFEDSDYSSYGIQMEIIVKKLTIEFCELFRQFILEVKFPESVEGKHLNFEKNSIFLNFNYTDTIEKYYGIKTERILYLHGKAKNKNDKIILGHGIKPEKFQIKESQMPKNLSEEEQDLWRQEKSDNYDFSYELGKDEIITYFKNSFKHTDEIIQNNNSFFSRIKHIKKIIVIGHSISEVDQPYFKKIINELKGREIIWKITYYSESEYESHIEKIKKLGIDLNSVELIKIESLKPILPELF
jgi:hypothetical protein